MTTNPAAEKDKSAVQEAEKDDEITGTILSTGYTLELEGNTHAEQCSLSKFARAHNVEDANVHEILAPQRREDGVLVLYTTMEPCILRLSGAMPCVDRIVAARHIQTVVCGVSEPDTFVAKNEGRARLAAAGVEVVKVDGMEEEILAVAKAGHVGSGAT